MPADACRFAVSPHDHSHRVPADITLDAPLDLAVARIRLLLLHRDGVYVGRVSFVRRLDPGALRALFEPLQQKLHPLPAVAFQDVLQRFQPLLGLERVGVFQAIWLSLLLHGFALLRAVPNCSVRVRTVIR